MFSLQVITCSGIDCAPSILVAGEKTRLLFNVGEGTQRAILESRAKLRKVDRVFLTQSRWSTLGGLPGFLMSSADSGQPRLAVHGPPGLTGVLAASRFFMLRSQFSLAISEYGVPEGHKFAVGPSSLKSIRGETKNQPSEVPSNAAAQPRTSATGGDDDADDISVTAFLVSATANEPGATAESNDLTTVVTPTATHQLIEGLMGPRQMYGLAAAVASAYPPAVPPAESASSPPAVQPSSHAQPSHHVAASYVVQAPIQPGKFDAVAAKALGVPAGPERGQLMRGLPITLADGTVVNPDQVISPKRPGEIFLIVAAPSIDFVLPLCAAPFWAPFHASGQQGQLVAAVVHLCPAQVLQSPTYRSWMHSFLPSAQHIVCVDQDPQSSPTALASSTTPSPFASAQTQLAALRSLETTMFGESDSGSAAAADSSSLTQLLSGLPDSTQIAQAGQSFVVKPVRHRGLHGPGSGPLSSSHRPSSTITDASIAEAQTLARQLKSEVPSLFQDPHRQLPSSPTQPSILFSGTGASLPSKYRNVSGILVDCGSDHGSVILDCGEGTLGQLWRALAPADRVTWLKTLRTIFVSHMHADHHLGLVRLLLESQRVRQQEPPEAARPSVPKDEEDAVVVVGPAALDLWLTEYARATGEQLNYKFLSCASASSVATVSSVPQLPVTIRCVPVRHCADAWGAVVEHRDGLWKVVYSGDTMPCPELAEEGRGATLLIHEATLEDGMETVAQDKRHSTTSQALQVGLDMNAENIILTHFSQRYSRVPSCPAARANNVGIAFDFLRVHRTQWPLLSRMTPVVDALFVEEKDGEDDITNELESELPKSSKKRKKQ